MKAPIEHIAETWNKLPWFWKLWNILIVLNVVALFAKLILIPGFALVVGWVLLLAGCVFYVVNKVVRDT